MTPISEAVMEPDPDRSRSSNVNHIVRLIRHIAINGADCTDEEIIGQIGPIEIDFPVLM